MHCFERECSLQRRRQKVWEEAPAAMLPATIRQSMCESAVALARSVGYRGAGTVEFLYDEVAGVFCFIEVNTRIQVEHPVTEMITGLDLVAQMFRIAGGEALALRQADITARGHSIEVRINAEDPAANFRPWPGQVEALAVPEGPDIRFDTLLYAGYTVPPFYDSLLGKLVVSAEDRPAAIARALRALGELVVQGVPTTREAAIEILRTEEFASGRYSTSFLEESGRRLATVAMS